MGELRFGARVFISLIVAVGAILTARNFAPGNWSGDFRSLLVLVGVVPAYVVADIANIRLHRKGVYTSLSTTIAFASLLIFDLATASLAVLLATAISEIWVRRVWYKAIFNVFTYVVLVNVAGAVFTLLNDGTLERPFSTVQNAVAIVVSGFTFNAANALIICIIVGLAEGYSPMAVWRASVKGFWFQLMTMVPIGALIAIVYFATPLGLLLLLFPILLTHYSYQAYQQLQTDSQRTMETLATAVDRRDPYTYHHSERVATFSERIAQQMGLDLADTETIVAAARVHDLGKIGIDSTVLLKPGGLDPREWAIMREHPRIGAEIVGQLPIYDQVRDLVACHQERYDGKGYPYGFSGERIPLGARIIAAADAFDAMTSDRPYRKALSQAVAMAELRKGSGTQFDPKVVEAFIAVLEADEEAARAASNTGECAPVLLDKAHSEQAVT